MPRCDVTHLEGAIDAARLPAGVPHTLHNGRPIWVRYDLPRINPFEAALAGANVFLVDGLINDCGKVVRPGTERLGATVCTRTVAGPRKPT